MTMGKTRKDEDIIRGMTEHQGNYISLDKDRLVLFAVDYLESNRIEPTFDKVVAATYKLFPKKFSLIGFPEYPDGKTIYYCVYNHCTLTKKWLFGNVQSGFKVTERGKYFFDETVKMLEGKIELATTHQASPRRKEMTFITMLKRTSAYKKYLQGEKGLISESDILEALRIPSTSQNMVQTYLAKYFEYSNRINESSVLEFLDFAKTKLRGGPNA